eukprot:CAMPEP_0171953230 /NCGR_PEP_ID=MMETSP0993-20121228/93888_1 /TAXON_ID=483369 /ORGANISM="non described non described, Strain CCMP2098" /LENGTH=461 /DNA_ID=CAMNT_0012598845 /DNA_START=16 /DNA_END=1398 /DNA_ORIENTATION=+
MPKKRSASISSSSSSSSSSSGSSSSSDSSGSDSEHERRKSKKVTAKKVKKEAPSKRQKASNDAPTPPREDAPTPPRRLTLDAPPPQDAPTPPLGEEKRSSATEQPPSSSSSEGAGAAVAETAAPTKFSQAEALKKAGGRTGGVYVPPFKLQALQRQMAKSDKGSKEYQRLKWEQLRKGINGLVNKINVANIKELVPEIFELNLVRGRGLLVRSVMKAQLASPGFTHIYAGLVAVLNTKLPEIGELVVKRVLVGFRRAYKRRDKVVATAFAKFIAHLVNHQVLHELAALQLLTVLLQDPTDDSVEIAVSFTKEVGSLLEQLSPKGLHAIFERFRGILHETTGQLDKRVQYTIEGLFAVRKGGFSDFPSVPPELDLVDRAEQITFEFGLDDADLDKQELLDVFRVDKDYDANEKQWRTVRAEILGESDDDSGGDSSGGSGSESDDEESDDEDDEEGQEGGGGG